MTDPRTMQAIADWVRIAPGLGLEPQKYRASLIWQKNETDRSHVVLRLKGPRNLILKRSFLRPTGDDPTRTVAAQKDAFARLADHPKAHVPEILFASDAGDLLVMAEATGKTLDEHLRKGRAHSPLLMRTGAWLSTFHSTSDIEERMYQPRFMVGYCERLADDVEAGTLTVADPERFMACARMVRAKAKDFTDRKTVSATKHGDFNLRNILLGPDGETGIDFKPLSTAPVGFDIVRILMDYAALLQPQGPAQPGKMLSEVTMDAFFRGYTLVTQDDPAVGFLPFAQIMNDWKSVPADPGARSWRQVARYDGIVRLTKNGFGVS